MPDETADSPLPPHEAIRAARRVGGLSLREVARRIGVSPATLSALENGRTGLSVTRLTEVAAALGVPAHQLLAGHGAAPVSAPNVDAAPEPGAWREFGPLGYDPVLTAAIASFVEIGYHGTTVRALARRAGTSVPGLYHHYRDKQEVLVRILDLTMDELHWRVAAARAEGSDGPERVRLIVEALALFHTHRRELGFIGASEMRSLLPADRARIARSRSRIQQILDAEIAAARDAGAFTAPHPRAAGRAIATMCTGISQWYREGGDATPEEIAAEYGRFALDMSGAV
ncbi:TetR family transcriptional regulator [Nocardia sp. NBC_00416]|uniref:TetR family transcriptional regulator n=1 Tax=Nocardia sp. NBC_00416 TaxID=2975991 RepID=UPI002E1BC2A2